MSSRFGPLRAGFVPPCLPSGSKTPPSGNEWLHEIKHDGFRVIARKVGQRVKLYSRPGNDLTRRFPLIVHAVSKLRASSCIIDGEAVACGEDGIACFELLLVRWDADGGVFLYAFDLIELYGEDLRAFCELMKIDEQNAAKTDPVLEASLDQLGADFKAAWDTAETIDEASEDGKILDAALDRLSERCPH